MKINMKNKKLIVFDLDGTITISRSRIDSEMAELLCQLIKKFKVSIISGGDFRMFEKQILPYLSKDDTIFSNFYICPTCSTRMYVYDKSKDLWVNLYSEDFSAREKEKIFNAFKKALYEYGHKPKKVYGEIIEDRGSQITFAALGQEAPLELKKFWDPNFKKRFEIIKILERYIPKFNIKIGGTTSIDITKKGIDKAYGIKKLQNILDIKKREIVFIGDALMPRGNDFPVKEYGVDCLAVSSPEETKEIIKKFILY